VFVHISAVEKAGYTNLVEGARISYELFTGRSGKSSAENLRLGLGNPPTTPDFC
jgi:CspA family cold shock protein